MSDKGWKQRERRIARRAFGVERIPVTGERDGADCENVLFAVQIKSRKVGLPKEVKRWLAGIQATGARKGKIGLLVCAEPRQEDMDAVVCLSLRDWVALHGGLTDQIDSLGPDRQEPDPDVTEDAREAQALLGRIGTI